jgi:hypothetical protein
MYEIWMGFKMTPAATARVPKTGWKNNKSSSGFSRRSTKTSAILSLHSPQRHCLHQMFSFWFSISCQLIFCGLFGFEILWLLQEVLAATEGNDHLVGTTKVVFVQGRHSDDVAVWNHRMSMHDTCQFAHAQDASLIHDRCHGLGVQRNNINQLNRLALCFASPCRIVFTLVPREERAKQEFCESPMISLESISGLIQG